MVIVQIDCSTLLCVASGGSASGERTIYRSQHLVKIRHESVYLVTYGDRPKSCDAAALDGTTHGTATPHTRRPHGSTTSRIRPRLACLLLQMHTSGSIARCMLWSWLLAPHVTSALCCVLQCRKATERCEKHERSRTERGSHSPRQCGLLTDGRALDVYHTGKASWWVRSDMWSWQWKACTRPSVPRSAPVAVDTDDRVIMSSIELQAVLMHLVVSRLPGTATSASCSSCSSSSQLLRAPDRQLNGHADVVVGQVRFSRPCVICNVFLSGTWPDSPIHIGPSTDVENGRRRIRQQLSGRPELMGSCRTVINCTIITSGRVV